MNQVGEEQEKFHLKENTFLSCRVICIYLGQSFPQTLSLPNGEWNEMIVSPHLPLLVQEPLRPEGLPVAPVLAFEELGKQGLRQETGLVQSLHYDERSNLDESAGRDGDAVDCDVSVRSVLDSIRDNVGVPLYLHQNSLRESHCKSFTIFLQSDLSVGEIWFVLN